MWAQVDGEHVAGCRKAAKRATSPCISEVCTDERRYGPVRVQAPYLTRSEDGQGPGVGTSSTTRPRSRAIPPSKRQALSTFLCDVEDVPAAGLRPGVLAEPRPQERVPRHTVGDTLSILLCVLLPMVQILDAPVPQTVEQLPDILRFFDTLMPDPEQVIEVPPDLARGRSLCALLCAIRSWRNSWWIVPTNPGYAFCRRCCPNPWVEDSSGANRAVR